MCMGMLSPRVRGYQNENSTAGKCKISLQVVRGVKETAQSADTIAIVLSCPPPELEGKSLLLKISHALDRGLGGLKVEVTWKRL